MESRHLDGHRSPTTWSTHNRHVRVFRHFSIPSEELAVRPVGPLLVQENAPASPPGGDWDWLSLSAPGSLARSLLRPSSPTLPSCSSSTLPTTHRQNGLPSRPPFPPGGPPRRRAPCRPCRVRALLLVELSEKNETEKRVLTPARAVTLRVSILFREEGAFDALREEGERRERGGGEDRDKEE